MATTVARPRSRKQRGSVLRSANVPGNLGRAVGNGVLLMLFMILMWYFA